MIIYNSQNLKGTIYSIFSNIFGSYTDNVIHAKFHSGTSVLTMRYDFILTKNLNISKYYEIFSYRKSKGLSTKLIIDWSLEGSCYWDEIGTSMLLNSFKEHQINIEKDVMFTHNDVINRVPMPKMIGQNLSIDYHAIEAYQKCINTSTNLTDTTLVKDRKNGLNLLIGKLKTKHARFLAAYYFYKYELLDSAVLGLHVLPEDIIARMKLHPNYYDMDFYNKILPLLGPADSVCKVHDTDEGCTAEQGGWPFDPAIFKNSSISYVCETYDTDKGIFPHLVTEKFYRSIINKHPFIVQASSGQLNTVKSLGFETFSSIIDESYNDYLAHDYSHVERTVLAAKDFLSKLPSNTDKIQEIVDYNYNHWLKRAKTEYDDTTNIFMSFINSV
jgi:hypothetical protein